MAIEKNALSLLEGQYFKKTSLSLAVHKSDGLYLETSFLDSLLTPFIQTGAFLFFMSGLSGSFSHLKNLFKIKCLLFHVPIHLCSRSSCSSLLNLFKYDKTSTFVICFKFLHLLKITKSTRTLIFPFFS